MVRVCFGQYKTTFPVQYYENGENVLDVPLNIQKTIYVYRFYKSVLHSTRFLHTFAPRAQNYFHNKH